MIEMREKACQNSGSPKRRILLGVARAVDSVNETIGKYRHIYTYGELIHNKDVIVELEKRASGITEDIDSVPQEESTVIIIRSHGVPKAVYQKIENRGFELLDLTPVRLSHVSITVCLEAGDMPVVIIGAEDHPEVTGIKGWAQGPVMW